MLEINFESELLILNIDTRSISKSFENKFEILKSFIDLHNNYNKFKHLCKDNNFVQFHNKLTSNADNSCLFYTGLEDKIKEKYDKPDKVQKYIDAIQLMYEKYMYEKAIIEYKIVKTKISCDKNNDKKRLVSYLFHVRLNNHFNVSLNECRIDDDKSKHLHIMIPLEYSDFHN